MFRAPIVARRPSAIGFATADDLDLAYDPSPPGPDERALIHAADLVRERALHTLHTPSGAATALESPFLYAARRNKLRIAGRGLPQGMLHLHNFVAWSVPAIKPSCRPPAKHVLMLALQETPAGLRCRDWHKTGDSNMLNDEPSSRRGILRAGLTILAGTLAATAARADDADGDKVEKSVVQYQFKPADNGDHCAICTNFLAPASCKVVKGPIVPNGWCIAFGPKGS